MNNKPENPHAFAFAHSNFNDEWVTSQGMTLRDYFAARVCASLLTPTSADRSYPNLYWRQVPNGPNVAERVAAISYGMADAMLAAREK